jgi:thioredoxin reductase
MPDASSPDGTWPETWYDTVIVGGGPAGLSAALILGRCRRRVLLCDAGHQRNLWSHAMHGYLTRDGIPPAEFLRIACAEIAQYGVETRACAVRSAGKRKDGFDVLLDDDTRLCARKLLIATGVADQLPPISNIRDFYGKSVHHCPYCDGWENRDRRIGVYSKKPGLAYSLKTWTSDVTLFTDGPQRFSRIHRERLQRRGIPVRTGKIARLEGEEGSMRKIVFEDGSSIDCDALFFSTGQHQACDLAQDLGCILNRRGTVETDKFEMSQVRGLYVAGDASRDVQMVIVAAAEGAKAAFAINIALQDQEGLGK